MEVQGTMTGRARDCVVAAHTCVRDAIIDINLNPGNQVLEKTLLTIADRLKGILDDDWAANKRAREEAVGKEEDIHTKTAAEVFETPPPTVSPEQRRDAKAVNFSILYGQSASGLSNQPGQLATPRSEDAR